MTWQNRFQSGLAHQKAGRLDAAERSYRATIAENPRAVEAHYNLGVVLQARERFRQAIHAFEKAARLDPGLAAARLGLGVALARTGEFDRAETELRAAIAAAPASADAHRFLGDLLRNLGRMEEARQAYLEALRCDPADAEARFGIAFVRLANGELPEAWEDYEFRKSKSGPSPALMPVWNGEDLTGKTLLVHGEQGLGDAIQFLRYVPLLAARGATVLSAVPREIMALSGTVDGVASVVEPTYALPRFDFSCPLPSLPRMFRTTLATVPNTVPYLRADAARIAAWRERLGETDGLTVAIAWSGNPKHPDNHRRSIAATDLAPLFKAPNVRFLAVQRDDNDIPRSANIQRLGAHDLGDVAAILSLADLTISVDTVFCHLAGALGRPIWTLLALSPDWRWQAAGDTTSWYPTMRLFRQRAAGEWADVIAGVLSALADFVATRGNRSQMPRAFGTPRAPVSWGELIDRLTILEIKRRRITAEQPLANIGRELSMLEEIARPVLVSEAAIPGIVAELRVINERLWDVEDRIREKEAKGEFDDEFIALARSVYKTNDERSAIKRRINSLLASELIEEKHYVPY